MKKRRKITEKVGLALLILAGLAMVFLPLKTWAQDFDGDGILDDDEGGCLPIGVNCAVFTNKLIPDLFVIRAIDPVNGFSLLPPEPFEFITRTQDLFHISLHEITFNDSQDRVITPTQNAIVLTEDLRTSDGDLGTSSIGTPANKVTGRVFSYRILEDVKNACSQQTDCEAVNSEGQTFSGVEAIFNYYAKNVVAHETFHMLNRVVPPDRKVDNHYPQLGYIMDHHMYYKVYKKPEKSCLVYHG